jgi:pimeloyl-ACP methyl ester carboxylesterase
MRLTVHRIPGLAVAEHRFQVPLDHKRPTGEELTVFAREVASVDRETDDLPWLVFFQGGPGYEAARPHRKRDPTWLERAVDEYRVLLLDQRGTGRSSPLGPTIEGSPEDQAEYLSCFRADAIVRDAEIIRKEMGIERWSVLGQSFGGFCVTSYLSRAPEGLAEAFLTGGLPPLDRHPDDVYRATYARTRVKNRAYFERYPEDRARVRQILERLGEEDVRLPSGDQLTPRRFRQLGMLLGAGDGFEQLHYIVELPFGCSAFLHDVDEVFPFARNPIYAVLHEACWANGASTRWSAERNIPDDFRVDVTMFTGEHIFPWMFREYGSLAPLTAVAHILAEREWPPLYDADRLRRNEVPVAAAIYAEDMYVERAFSEETAATIRGLRSWITNEYEHDGLRADGARILGRLIDLARGRV